MKYVFIVGPSGAGKDTLLGHARGQIGDAIAFSRRVITRPSDATEDHIPVTDAAFAALEDAGAFDLSWRAHGLCYGIPRPPAGTHCAIASVSREVIPAARGKFACHVIEITAAPAILRARLLQRGRETSEDINERLVRAVPILADSTISNDTTVEQAGAQLVAVIRAIASGAI